MRTLAKGRYCLRAIAFGARVQSIHIKKHVKYDKYDVYNLYKNNIDF